MGSEFKSGKAILLFSVSVVAAALAAAGAVTLMTAKPAAVRVVSEPAGASVFVNDLYRGVTPVDVTHLYPTEHVVRVVRDHYEPWQQVVKAKAGANEVKAELVYRQGGTLAVSSTPVGAEVYLDGERKGVTPMVIQDVEPGLHPVRLVLVNCLEWEGQTEVLAGRRAPLEVKLKSRLEDYLLRATRTQPKDAGTWTELFHYYVIHHEYDKAPEALAKGLDALTKWPEANGQARPRLFQEIGKIWNADNPGREVDVGDKNEVEKARLEIERGFELAVELAPENPTNYTFLLAFYELRDRVDKGNSLLEKGLVRFVNDRSWYMPWDTREVRDMVPGRIQRDEEMYLKARVGKTPGDNVARIQLATQLERAAKLDEAIEQYPELIKRFQKPLVQFTLWQALGNLQERRSRNAEAMQSYEKALTLDAEPKLKAALLYRLVRLKREGGDMDAAIRTWDEAIRVQPDVEYACRWRLALAELCVTEKRYEKVREVCREVLRVSKDTVSQQRAQKMLDELPKS